MNQSAVSILDYGVGNLASIANALNFLGVRNSFARIPEEVSAAVRLILPGVGAFGPAMAHLRRQGLVEAIREHAVKHGRPVLGLCLGMQLLLDGSHEDGWHDGLGILRGQVQPLSRIAGSLVVPHVGWNDVVQAKQSTLLTDFPDSSAFYFVHSYYCELEDHRDILGTTSYGAEFPSMLARANVFGCQFHPEKSQRCGLAILKNFSAVS
jgi:glutamine amidotransferase